MAYGPSVAKGCIAEMVELAKERRFRGVVAKGHRFRAQIQINGRQINLGKFSSPAQAAQRCVTVAVGDFRSSPVMSGSVRLSVGTTKRRARLSGTEPSSISQAKRRTK
jgi:hypothetical protein